MEFDTPEQLVEHIQREARKHNITVNPLLLRQYALEYFRWRDAETQVQELGLMVREPGTNNSVVNPFIQVSRDARKEMDKISLGLGIDGMLAIKRKVGRPRKYQKSMCSKLLECMNQGMSVLEVCAELGISKDTFYVYVDEFPEFSDSYKKGQDLSQAWWERLGRQGAVGIVDLNVTSWIFNMKNRYGWKDKGEITQNTTVTLTEIEHKIIEDEPDYQPPNFD